MKRLITITTLLFAVGLPSAAYGIEPPLKISDHGTRCKVVSVSGGYAVECAGKLSGLGSTTTTIALQAAFACTNRGGNQPPGQVSGQSEPITPNNGQVTFDVTTGAGSCPDQMRPTFGPTATINVYQNGVLVFTEAVPINQ
jgi:hypothetical protein